MGTAKSINQEVISLNADFHAVLNWNPGSRLIALDSKTDRMFPYLVWDCFKLFWTWLLIFKSFKKFGFLYMFWCVALRMLADFACARLAIFKAYNFSLTQQECCIQCLHWESLPSYNVHNWKLNIQDVENKLELILKLENSFSGFMEDLCIFFLEAASVYRTPFPYSFLHLRI